MGLLRFLFILLLIYLFFRVFTAVILPFILRFSLRRFQKKFYEQNPHIRPDAPREEGEVTIHKVSDDEKQQVPPDIGEYIDYEEIK
ncbi:MAG: hypothetical protein CVU14_00040 [Bacteroidetes bacterium HGW-Bacteroidetes-9]|jgi:hypothetical protein|nr:MAG: hypothetical protein CVU14_00040 [Bacteroidetes bacterium HGW-Bacteroidetes-9]